MITDFDVLPILLAGFGLKSVRTFPSREGTGYSATLLFKGAPVAEVSDAGDGGCEDIRWLGITYAGTAYVPDTATPAQRKKIEAQAALTIPAKAELERIIATTPAIQDGEYTLTVDAGWVVRTLVDFQPVIRACKKKTLFRTADGREMEIKREFSPALRTYILNKYPGATIYNVVLAA